MNQSKHAIIHNNFENEFITERLIGKSTSTMSVATLLVLMLNVLNSKVWRRDVIDAAKGSEKLMMQRQNVSELDKLVFLIIQIDKVSTDSRCFF